ncbi:MAG: phosphate/phosphite/phosphonate ABC transporter substrate-binding protein [Candidatus Viridilinea halotolerans]|uniref:Phosphate/phosphite/phosphonate ABC transporter substrate-binding protein n=1 Tax=Candidatus Viridilinea halotolerans TaxID=2491704 RepID=A0A426UB56_9CHLR|nr:MAG: phosphate/phosphite/phosphonate ABC transporter substrate-binding protein [Candidatus Viridilinea halotolerans]
MLRLSLLVLVAILLLAACGAEAPASAPAAPATEAPAAEAPAAEAPAAEAPAAEACPRPAEMDARFCDADGDLVADPPQDATQWVNPDTLIFAYTPVEDPAVYRDAWADFLAHMEAMTGKQVEFFAVDSNAAQLEAMRAGRLHVAGFNTGSNPFAVNFAGFVPFTMMAAADGSFGYEMEIIVPANSPVQSIEDLRGRQVAFTSPTSNSGFKAPSALLDAQFGMVEGTDFEATFSGSHDNSILGVANEDYEAAAIANSVLRRMIEREVVSADQVRSIYVSETFPTTGYGYVYNLDPELAAKVREAFFSFDWAGSSLEEEFSKSGEAQFIPITYKEYWSVIREIDTALGVTYTQP